MITEDELSGLVGTAFPSGTFTIEPYQHWLTADAILAPAGSDSIAHPMYGYYAALGGMGLSIDELFALVGSSASDGPMFGEAGIEFSRPLEVGATYSIEGGITDIVRKKGRRAGVFDIVTFELRVIAADGDVAAVSTNSFVFPRRSA